MIDPQTLDRANLYSEKILEFLEITEDRDFKNKGTYVQGPAPCHQGDNPTGFLFNMSSCRWFCWTHHCHEDFLGKGIIGLIMAVKKVDENMAVEMAENIILDNIDKITIVKKPEQKKQVINYWAKHMNQKPLHPIDVVPASEYCIERGLDLDVVNSYGIGIGKNNTLNGRFIVPIRNLRGEIIAFTGRLTSYTKGSKQSKWLHFPAGFSKSINLFNIENLNKNSSGSVILVEGPLDVIKFEMAGVRNSVAVLGDNICIGQIDLLQKCHITDVIIALDNDEAGRKGTERIARKLEKRLFRLWTLIPEGAKDWGDMSTDNIKALVKNKKRV